MGGRGWEGRKGVGKERRDRGGREVEWKMGGRGEGRGREGKMEGREGTPGKIYQIQH